MGVFLMQSKCNYDAVEKIDNNINQEIDVKKWNEILL